MQVRVSPEINAVLEKAAALSVHRGQFFVGVEHLYDALIEQDAQLPQAVTDQHRTMLQTVAREVAREAWKNPAPQPDGEVFYTPRCANLINEAARLAERSRAGQPRAGHLLLAILTDAQSAPSRVMDRFELHRGELVQLLQQDLAAKGGAPAKKPEGAVGAAAVAAAPSGAAEAKPKDDAFTLESVTHDLTEDARQGKITAAFGRDQDIFEMLQVLTRKTKNNVILVGEAGVGKTKVVEGLAVMLLKSSAEGLLPGCRILELSLSAMMTGTAYRGAFEEKVMALIEELKRSKDIILFIDEVHLIMGAGATEGSSVDFANLLKPALARGEIRCIGATTLQEYRKFVERDPAIERRFQLVRVEELSEEATLEVLKVMRPSLEAHHNIRIGSKAIQAAVTLTQRYMTNRRLPDKAIDVLDQACARYRLKSIAAKTNPALLEGTLLPTAVDKVTPHDIRKVISQITAVPVEEMTSEERQHLRDLERVLKKRLIGQDEAIAKVASAVKKSRAGLADPNRPDAVLLFMGPTGVGKTQLAKLLADTLFGSANHLVTFDMSEFIEEHSVSRLLGAPPGYAGCEEEGRLSSAVRSAPFSVLLFDEIEKAHPRIFDIFLPIFDEGRSKDNRGREISFKNCIIILTTNIGSECLSRSAGDDRRAEMMDALRQHFRPEFINRIDEIVPFYSLLYEDVATILRMCINDLRGRLIEKQIGIRMYREAYEHLAEEGYKPEFGARELRRVVDREVAAPISELVLGEEYKSGGMIDVKFENGELTFTKGAPHRQRESVDTT